MKNLKISFRGYYTNTLLGRKLDALYKFYRWRLLPEVYYVRQKYKRIFGVYPDLKCPKSLNEKILWLKLNDRTPLHTLCADKFAVREYVRDTIGEKYLIPLLYTTHDPRDIVPENIPNEPSVIKTNHDSSGVIFVRDKKEVDWKEIQKKLNRRIKSNYYWRSKEWQYKNIIPRILVEKLLEDENKNNPFDYKFHCFNGTLRMIQVDMNRGTSSHRRNWYSPKWKREPYKWTSPLGNNNFTDPSKEDIEPPKNFDQMVALSQNLAKPFKYVRVDWYNLNGRLYFGELTFHHDGGYRPIEPYEWDLKLGAELNLGL
ncbi:ATP-grasp fold amidoligase family protein [Robiginitalea sp. SC105]|uniref:ATP-grasp fold amidoligase family protein n=1 Tax=Robiginitalea sp. SC105 TaxID=2762332 RepID=UPI00163B5629|nr:ATP-grasp fold amidoligase family protein [Robiginitalea sp. SC105]MBC2840331.1 glycosyl transferase [Robiginitalea sp. SC105]